MRSRPSGSELALRNRGIATGALRRSCSHSSRHFEPRYYREQKEESQCIWTRSEAVLEKELWIIFFSRYVALSRARDKATKRRWFSREKPKYMASTIPSQNWKTLMASGLRRKVRS